MANEGNKSEPQKEIVFVESDFLFGLRRSDVRHLRVICALDHKKDGFRIEILSSAVIEVRIVLASRRFESKTIEEILSLMAA